MPGVCLSERQLERYGRHILLGDVGLEGQRKLLSSKVVVVGVGGLGCPCALYLAAAGVGTIGLVDGDKVALSNLQRQILYWSDMIGQEKVDSAKRVLQKINPDIRVREHPFMLDSSNAEKVLCEYDLVVNGCDNFPTRYLLNDACVFLGKPLVDAGILRFEGQATVYREGKGCYRCLFPSPPPPECVPSCAEAGVMGALAGIMGSIQALEAIKVLLGIGRCLDDRLLLYDALRGECTYIRRTRNPECPVCGDNPSITKLMDYRNFCGLSGEDDMLFGKVKVPELTSEQAYSQLKLNPEIQFIDVREPAEFNRVHAKGATLIPLGEVESRMGELDSTRPVFVICARGGRSLKAAKLLKRKGFDVSNVSDGTIGWVNSGLPVE